MRLSFPHILFYFIKKILGRPDKYFPCAPQDIHGKSAYLFNISLVVQFIRLGRS